MSASINERIIDKIDESEYSKDVRDFLKSILLVELLFLETGRYSKEYDSCISKFLRKEG